jgi:hypothetical protein
MQKVMEPDQFTGEVEFLRLIKEIELESRLQNGPESVLKPEDSFLVERMSYYRGVSSKSLDNMLSRLMRISKQEL